MFGQFYQGPLNGGVSNGGFPDLDLSFLFCPFWDFPDFSGILPICSGNGPGIFPIRHFSLSRPIKSTYEEQSRKGPRHNLDLSRKKRENTRVWTPPGLASPNFTILWGSFSICDFLQGRWVRGPGEQLFAFCRGIRARGFLFGGSQACLTVREPPPSP